MRYAVNIGDLVAAGPLKSILAAVIEPEPVEVEPGEVSGMGVRIKYPDEQGAAWVEIIRKKFQRHQVRCYQSQNGVNGWKRV